jgi:hypothetical protein
MFSSFPLPKLPGARRLAAGFLSALVAVCLLSDSGSSFAAPRPKRSGAAGAKKVAAERSAKTGRPAKIGTYNPADETVEMFDAIEAGKIQVKIIPKNSAEARVFIKNKANKAVNVRLPKAFAAVPILAQGMGGMGMGGGGQALGGGGGAGGGGMFNIPADREGDFKVACVCLEHGKPEPRPQMAYSIKPLDSYTTKPGIAEMLTELGEGRIPQRAAQVAAWHLQNGMSWEELTAKRIDLADGRSYPYFTADELLIGRQIVEQSLTAAKRPKKNDADQPSLGETAAK